VSDQREEFVRLAGLESVSFSELCRRFSISRKTGYKWLERWRSEGAAGLSNQSCRPRSSPARTPSDLEEQVLEVRAKHPAWGARKIAHVLKRDREVVLATSTVNSILRRHGCISAAASEAAKPWQRFEHEAPNDLWQMDFKGHFPVGDVRCHPLTVIDDHSRYNLVLQASDSESYEFVKATLQRAFEHYGLPQRINTDNGAPWRAPGLPGFTRLGLWFVRLGIRLSHSRPAHPQTNGKDERFHRSFKAEVLGLRSFDNLVAAQIHFDDWRRIYNHVRPHDSLQMDTPSQHYRPSARSMPTTLPPVEYGPDDLVRKVQAGGFVDFKGRKLRVYESLRGQHVAFRPRIDCENTFDLFFCLQQFGSINLTEL
jgi:transposase InsO family protein